MKRVTIIGIGTGISTLTQEAQEAIDAADVLLGSERLLVLCQTAEKPSYPYYSLSDVTICLAQSPAKAFAILVSGDVGFYSAAALYAEALTEYELRMIPGISSMTAFFARLRMPWQDAAFVSAHGRETDIVSAVRRNRLTFCLTGNNTQALGAALAAAELGHVPVHVGENLGMDTERIRQMTTEELTQSDFSSLTVLLFVNDCFDASVLCGLTDSRFVRMDGIPMTKSEVRAIVLSKLNLHPADICWDVGAGTGSVAIEMALGAYRGHVYAVERKAEAIPLIQQNSAAFHVGNLTPVCGDAPEALLSLPAPDAVFIGGSRGEMDGIVSATLDKNPCARIVATAVTVETVSAALQALAKAGLEPELVQVSVSRGKRVGGLHMLEAQNPITILWAGGQP